MINTKLLSLALTQAREKFQNTEKLGSKLLLLSTVVALVWANSPWQHSYYELWHTPISINVGRYILSNSLAHWINDGLMFIFFLVIGLEVKRELLVGELRSLKRAALPLFGALGGMIVPAIIYLIFNWNTSGMHGWGVPMATDIAFALGVLMVLGDRIPGALKVFLLALAIFDDLGAILIIALFYSSELSFVALGVGFFILAILALLNYVGIRRLTPYVILGIFLWLAFLQSGVHATIAGVLLAFTIPARPNYSVKKFMEKSVEIWRRFPGDEYVIMSVNDNQINAFKAMTNAVENVRSPLRRMEEKIHPWSSLFIIPVFALANAGVNFTSGGMGFNISHPVTLGVICGLCLGKTLGITFFSWVAVKLGMANLPGDTDFKALFGLSVLGGIGFTMSLFIINLAFIDELLIHQAKIGILIASLLSAVVGLIILRLYYGNAKTITNK